MDDKIENEKLNLDNDDSPAVEVKTNFMNPGVVVDPGYFDINKMGLPSGNWKAEIPTDSFYNFINKPEDNKQQFEELVKSLAEGGFMTEQPTIIGTKEQIDKFKLEPDISTTFPKSLLDTMGQTIMTNLGVPMEMISTGSKPNRNGNTYSTSNMSDAEIEAMRNEMNILREKNDKYLGLIQQQAEALKSKDEIIKTLQDKLVGVLGDKLDDISGGNVPVPPPKATGQPNVWFASKGQVGDDDVNFR